jgi:hypothetical protein
MFSVSDDGAVVELDAAAHLSPQRLVEKYGAQRKLRWAGSGAHLQRDFLGRYATEQEIALVEELHESDDRRPQSNLSNLWTIAARETNLAKSVAALALQLFQAGKLQSPDFLSAIYVRPSDAELNQQCR